MAAVEQLKLDIAELTQLLQQASRQKVKDILGIEIRKLQSEVSRKLEEEGIPDGPTPEKTAGGDTKPRPRPIRDIKTYAWDQSDKFMKIYVTDLAGVQAIPNENITSEFTERSFKLIISDFSGKDHKVHVVKLFDPIDPAASYHKVKSDMVTVFLKKSTEKKTWAFVTEQEKTSKDKKKPLADNKDPSSGLMDMMKQMYDDGDDEMKRTIAKAWTESQDKKKVDPGLDADAL